MLLAKIQNQQDSTWGKENYIFFSKKKNKTMPSFFFNSYNLSTKDYQQKPY